MNVVFATVLFLAAVPHPLDFAEHRRPYTEVKQALVRYLGAERWASLKATPPLAFNLRQRWIGEDQEGFVSKGHARTKKTYLYTPRERRPYEITIGMDGLLYGADRKPFGTGAHETLLVEDAASGKLYALELASNRFVHASFNAGAPTTISAEVKVKDGRVRKFKNRSGHYRMDRLSFMRAMDDLEAHGLDLSSASVEFDHQSLLEPEHD